MQLLAPYHINNESNKVITLTEDYEWNTDGSEMEPLNGREKDWPRLRSHFLITNCKNVVIDGINMRGPNTDGGIEKNAWKPQYEGQHAIEIQNCENVTIRNAQAYFVYGDLVYIKNSRNITIERSWLHHNGRQGIAIIDASNVYIRNNHIEQIRRACVDIEPNNDDSVVENIYITNNVFGEKRLKFMASGGYGTVRNVILEDNVVNNSFDCAIGNGVKPRMNFSFNRNHGTRPYGNGTGDIWKLHGVDGFIADGNHLYAGLNYGRPTMRIIGSIDSKNILLGNNTIVNGLNEIIEL